MSRSRKKHPILQYAPKSGKIGKNFANRRVRRYQKGIPTKGYSFLKKIYNPYDVRDCWSRETLQEALEYREKILRECENGITKYGYKMSKRFVEEYESVENVIQKWKKNYWRK